MNEQINQQSLQNTGKEQPRKVGKWSKIALISSLGGWIFFISTGIALAGLLFILIAIKVDETHFDFLFTIIIRVLTIFSTLIFIIGTISAVVALVQIRKKKEDPKGISLALVAMYLSGIYFVLLLSVIFFIPRLHQASHDRVCKTNLSYLGKGLHKYAAQHDGLYPDSNKWCDSLIKDVNIDEWKFCCTLLPEQERNCHNTPYTLNHYFEPNSAGNIVLLFETEPGWNKSGGPEIAIFQHYNRCPVLFNNGRVEFVAKRKIKSLNWSNQDPNCDRKDIFK